VPTAAEWQDVFAILGTGQNGSFLVSNALKLPPAGLRSYNTAAAYNLKYTGRHWSSTPFSTTNAYNVNFDKDKIELVSGFHSYGISVRCFKNAPDTEAPVITLL
jgi:hexokinase